MHDLKYIRENPEAFDAALKRRGAEAVSASVLTLDEKRRAVQTEAQMAQARRNEVSKAIGAAMGKGDTAMAEALKAEVAELKDRLSHLEGEERALGEELHNLLAALPNLPFDDVPDGIDEDDNLELTKWGAKPEFDFSPREHSDIGPPLGLDFETGVAMSGARFTFMRGAMARLNRAIGQFLVDHQTQVHGYMECVTPYMVNTEAAYGTGQLPKFAEDLFQTTDGRWLISTAEMSLTNSVREQILDEAVLPIRLTALTPCFRSEAGAAGRDTKGLIRQHQFEKVELVSIVCPDDSPAEHERMTAAAESALQALGLHYRKVLLCTGDMGNARKTYDLEVWLPGQGQY
ncbi:MAG: serine--tRNA ligase, partial [Sphingomonadaceae bacterium]|nr:serine--tRNA ligase [Sphingomonadaceae bacterium]